MDCKSDCIYDSKAHYTNLWRTPQAQYNPTKQSKYLKLTKQKRRKLDPRFSQSNRLKKRKRIKSFQESLWLPLKSRYCLVGNELPLLVTSNDGGSVGSDKIKLKSQSRNHDISNRLKGHNLFLQKSLMGSNPYLLRSQRGLYIMKSSRDNAMLLKCLCKDCNKPKTLPKKQKTFELPKKKIVTKQLNRNERFHKKNKRKDVSIETE